MPADKGTNWSFPKKCFSHNGQTHFKNLAVLAARFLKECLTILGHYSSKLNNHKKGALYQEENSKITTNL